MDIHTSAASGELNCLPLVSAVRDDGLVHSRIDEKFLLMFHQKVTALDI
jgi:hypothetical protein